MPLADLQAAREMAQKKGLPYQTYMKMLLHQALEKERRAKLRRTAELGGSVQVESFPPKKEHFRRFQQ